MNAYMKNISVEAIGPEEAAAYLRRSTLPKDKLNYVKVAKFGDAMQTGKWGYPGGTIEIDLLNRLKDGHHRLHAIVRYGVTLPMIVVRGLPFNTG